MSPEQVTDVAREAVWAMVMVGAPTMLVALVIGLVISLVQALTQVQEATLSFVPKLLAILVTIVLTTPFAIATLRDLTRHLFDRVIAIGAA